VTTPGKRSLPPPPQAGEAEHMREPTKNMLRDLRDQLAEHANTPPPPELYRQLHGLINWAAWRIDRSHLTREQIRYQRWRVVDEGIREFVARTGRTRGARNYGYSYAAKELVGGPYAGNWRTIQDDYLFEERAGGDDPRSVRRREALEQRAREADSKRTLEQRAREADKKRALQRRKR
jgi:hypothetical protein